MSDKGKLDLSAFSTQKQESSPLDLSKFDTSRGIQSSTQEAEPKAVELPQEELTPWESFKNKISNIPAQTAGILSNVAGGVASAGEAILPLDDKPYWEDLESKVREEGAYEGRTIEEPLPEIKELLDSKASSKIFQKSADISSGLKPSVGVWTAMKSGDPMMTLSSIAGSGIDVARSAAGALASGGTLTLAEMLGGSYVEANKEKADELGISVEELMESDNTDALVPLTIGAIGYRLEKAGLKGVTKEAYKRIIGNSSVRSGLMNASKEAVTEWIQTGLEGANRKIARTEDGVVDESIDFASTAVDTMFSEEGMNALLGGGFGSGVMSGTSSAIGRGVKSLKNDPSENVAKELADNVVKVSEDDIIDAVTNPESELVQDQVAKAKEAEAAKEREVVEEKKEKEPFVSKLPTEEEITKDKIESKRKEAGKESLYEGDDTDLVEYEGIHDLDASDFYVPKPPKRQSKYVKDLVEYEGETAAEATLWEYSSKFSKENDLEDSDTEFIGTPDDNGLNTIKRYSYDKEGNPVTVTITANFEKGKIKGMPKIKAESEGTKLIPRKEARDREIRIEDYKKENFEIEKRAVEAREAERKAELEEYEATDIDKSQLVEDAAIEAEESIEDTNTENAIVSGEVEDVSDQDITKSLNEQNIGVKDGGDFDAQFDENGEYIDEEFTDLDFDAKTAKKIEAKRIKVERDNNIESNKRKASVKAKDYEEVTNKRKRSKIPLIKGIQKLGDAASDLLAHATESMPAWVDRISKKGELTKLISRDFRLPMDKIDVVIHDNVKAVQDGLSSILENSNEQVDPFKMWVYATLNEKSGSFQSRKKSIHKSLENANEMSIWDDFIEKFKKGDQEKAAELIREYEANPEEFLNGVETEVYDYARDYHERTHSAKKEASRKYYGRDLDYIENYSHKKVLGGKNFKPEDTSEMLITRFLDDDFISAAESASTKKRGKTSKVVYDTDFLASFISSVKGTETDIHMAPVVSEMKALLEDKNLKKNLGEKNANGLKKYIKNAIGTKKGGTSIRSSVIDQVDPLGKSTKAFSSFSSTVKKSMLSLPSQYAKQLLPALGGVAATYSPDITAKAISLAVSAPESWIKEHAPSLYMRKEHLNHLVLEAVSPDVSGPGRGFMSAQKNLERMADKTTGIFLGSSDYSAAKLVFFADYINRGGTLESPDSDKVALAVNTQENAQGISSIDYAPPMFISGDPLMNVLVKSALSFTLMPLNITRQLINNAPKAFTDANSARLTAMATLNGFIFNATSQAIVELLDEARDTVFGEDDEEDEGFKFKDGFFRRVALKSAFDLVFGGFTPVQNAAGTQMEKLNKALVESEQGEGEYGRDDQVFYNYGSFMESAGPQFAAMEDAFNAGTGVLGIAIAEASGEDVSDEEKNLVIATALESYLTVKVGIVPAKGIPLRMIKEYKKALKSEIKKSERTSKKGSSRSSRRGSRRSVRSRDNKRR